jgi:hypothetical protein
MGSVMAYFMLTTYSLPFPSLPIYGLGVQNLVYYINKETYVRRVSF